MLPRRTTTLLALMLSMAMFTGAPAATRVVVFGGGATPASDQVSLLSNAKYFARVRELLGLGKAPCDTYFADGGKDKIVQASANRDPRQDVVDTLAIILYNQQADTRYRKVDLANLSGASTRHNLEKWFDDVGATLTPRDQLIFYFTGHGGPDDEHRDSPRNTRFYLWGDANYSVTQFIEQLDKLDPRVQTTLIMVQCYSGGFANVIYKRGNPSNGFSDHLRAGFFSTIASRMAAGCTSEIDEDDYQEFSTSFFEGLCGESRTGKSIGKAADYDHDGTVSFAEAFGYANLHEPTIDVPICTSDQLLRDKSRYRNDEDDAAMLPQNAPWSQVLEAATPVQKIVLEQLSEQLNLAGENRLSAATTLANDLAKDSRQVRRPRQPANGFRQGNRFGPGPEEQSRQRLRQAVLDKYPELAVPLNPEALATLDANWREIKSFLESQPDYTTFTTAMDRRQQGADARDKSDVKWALYERLIERANTVILAHNLPSVGDAETTKAYQTLIGLEGRTLGNSGSAK